MNQRRRKAPGREARNERRKLLAAYMNALAVALSLAAFAGPILNPATNETLTPAIRVILCLLAVAAHLVAQRILADIEDK